LLQFTQKFWFRYDHGGMIQRPWLGVFAPLDHAARDSVRGTEETRLIKNVSD
jgi:hypothetical protein